MPDWCSRRSTTGSTGSGVAGAPPAKPAEQDEADGRDHDLNRREGTVEVDALVEGVAGDQPGMAGAVGQMEIDCQERSADGSKGGEPQHGRPRQVRRAVPGEEPDERPGDENGASTGLAELDRIAEDIGVGDDGGLEEGDIPRGGAGRF